MAPVNNPGMNLDDDQRFALMKFRRSVSDVCNKTEHNDYFLLRWLRARSWNAEAAEKMLRDSMSWREKWAIETMLPSWEPPEVIKKHFPSGLAGFDKDGSPIIIVPFAGLDLWGLLHSVSKSDMIRMIIKVLEYYLKLALEQSEKNGPNARQLVCVMDMEGFSMRQYAWRPAGELVISLLQMYEANYPEILKMCHIVNTPKVFSLAFAIVKKFINEYTMSKIKIHKADPKKWQPVLLETIDPDQLPKHFGGTQVDPDGDPKCSSRIKPGGKVPKNYYNQQMTDEQKANYNNVTIKNGEKHTVDLICAEPGCFLKWEFGVEEADIKFGINCLDGEGVESVSLAPKKISGNALETGLISVNGPATYTVIFDNSSSFMKNKTVYYNVEITPPLSDLSLSSVPTD
ncbi:SEC14-like protein 2 [Arctopsyche grandis]|uniref:SEC14-like protein 2 n=1 Tax=Arctopsyche grandis TaxID=121162 RepID=UPI00406D7921